MKFNMQKCIEGVKFADVRTQDARNLQKYIKYSKYSTRYII